MYDLFVDNKKLKSSVLSSTMTSNGQYITAKINEFLFVPQDSIEPLLLSGSFSNFASNIQRIYNLNVLINMSFPLKTREIQVN